MNDKEQLELAAKAAGVVGIYYESANPIHTGIFAGSTNRYWNPLLDDGDALRLAVTLGLNVGIYPVSDKTITECFAPGGRHVKIEVFHGGAALIATRKAIVRAAAEIGKGVVTPNLKLSERE